MQASDAPLLGDEPLNLDQDDLLQSGRCSTCQQEIPAVPAEICLPPSMPGCCDSLRELHQADFQRWLS